MGGAQSAPTRKLSIPNEGNMVLKVSDSVVERLRQCSQPPSQEEFSKKKDDPLDCPPSELRNAVNKENIENYPGDPLLNFYYGPSVTSIRILQEKEKELKETEEYWNRRIKNMEKNHEQYSKILEKEYKKAIEEVSRQSPRPPPNTPFPCKQEKNKLLECYKKHPNEVLLCAGEVTHFADCVHIRRVNVDKKEGIEEK